MTNEIPLEPAVEALAADSPAGSKGHPQPARIAEYVRPPAPEFVPPIGDEPGVWIFWPADYLRHNDGDERG